MNSPPVFHSYLFGNYSKIKCLLYYVLLTHMDIDHESGLRLVRNAGQILVSP